MSRRCFQALLAPEQYTRETVIQENGKVVFDDDAEGGYSVFHLPPDYYDVKAARPLRMKKKLYEFYTAPIAKFWAHSVSTHTFF